MRTLDDIIEFENENTALDFKAIQYQKNKFEDLLTDIIALSNANSNEAKYIIVGVNHKPNGNRDIIGINEPFIDEATYQQLINENIEPEIEFHYSPYQFKTKTLGVFQIKAANNRPYMMKKDFGKLKKGDSFIRKGSHQTRITRKDIDSFFSQKFSLSFFNGTISVYFTKSSDKVLEVKATSELIFPSDKMAEKIEKIIKEKEDILKLCPGLALPMIPVDIPSIFGSTPYEHRSISTLKDNLKNIKETYLQDDIYYLFEKKSNKINITILNSGDEYMEDASVELKIKKSTDFMVADSIHYAPNHESPLSRLNAIPMTPKWVTSQYPKVTETEEMYIITENLGDIKHKIPQEIFGAPLRIILKQDAIGQVITFYLKIFGKNLKDTIEEKLEMIIIE